MLSKTHFLSVGIYFLSFCAAIYLSNPSPVHFYGNKNFEKTDTHLFYKGQLFNGTTLETFPDGSTYRTTQYRNGLMHGQSEEFGTTGARRAQWNYKNGKKQGWQLGWFIEGPRKFKRHYLEGLLDGTTTEWFMQGSVYRHQTYKKGIEVSQKVYFQTGEIFSNYVIRKKRIYGLNSGQLCMDYKKDGEI